MGNMVGVSITKVHPAAGHVFSEILDLLIAVWSITVAGLVIGFISGFGCVSAMVNGADHSFHCHTTGLNSDKFQTLCASKGLKLTVPRIREIFDEADVDGSNIIESSKVEELLSRMRNEVEGGLLSSGLSIADLITRMDEMDSKIGCMTCHVLCGPPGMIEGPLRAPSSPPDTPAPMKRRPCSAHHLSRRSESV